LQLTSSVMHLGPAPPPLWSGLLTHPFCLPAATFALPPSPRGRSSPPPQRFVEGTALWDTIKKVAMASFAMKATERDPDFVDNFYKVTGWLGQHA